MKSLPLTFLTLLACNSPATQAGLGGGNSSGLSSVAIGDLDVGVPEVTKIEMKYKQSDETDWVVEDLTGLESPTLKLSPGDWQFALYYSREDAVIASTELCKLSREIPVVTLSEGPNNVDVKVCLIEGEELVVKGKGPSKCDPEEVGLKVKEATKLNDVECKEKDGKSSTDYSLTSWIPFEYKGFYGVQGVITGTSKDMKDCSFSVAAKVPAKEGAEKQELCAFGIHTNLKLRDFETGGDIDGEDLEDLTDFQAGFALYPETCSIEEHDHQRKSPEGVFSLEAFVSCEGESEPRSIGGLVVGGEEQE